MTKISRNMAGLLAFAILAQLLFSLPTYATGEINGTIQQETETATALAPSAAVPASTPSAIGLTPAAIGITPSAIGLTPAATDLTPAAVQLTAKPPVDDESVWYRSQNPMKKEHQKILWENAKRNRIDYLDMLALVYTESNFVETCVASKRFYGYFQISKGHFADLAYSLQTENAPLNGAINIRWGTAMYGWIMASKRVQSLAPEKRRDAALSIYNRGPIGFDRYGPSKPFLARFYQKRAIVEKWFASEKILP